jgi:hypothetical protein
MDVSTEIFAQQQALPVDANGNHVGEIVISLDATDEAISPIGEFTSVVTIGPYQTLRLGPGQYKYTGNDYSDKANGQTGYIFLKDHSAIIGSGWNTVLHEPQHGESGDPTAIIAAFCESGKGVEDHVIQYDIAVRDLSVAGEATKINLDLTNESSAAVNLGNTVNGYIDRVYFKFVSGMGAQMGGTPAHPPGENQWVTNCLFVGCYFNAIACVNARDTHIIGNTIRKQLGGICVDYEPNGSAANDVFDISNNLIDLRTWDGATLTGDKNEINDFDGVPAQIVSGTPSADGIVIQTAYGDGETGERPPLSKKNHSGVIANNLLIGGSMVPHFLVPRPDGEREIIPSIIWRVGNTGIVIQPGVDNVLICNNNIHLFLNEGIVVASDHNVIKGNRLQDLGGASGYRDLTGVEIAESYWVTPAILVRGSHNMIFDNFILVTEADSNFYPANSIEEHAQYDADSLAGGPDPGLAVKGDHPDYNQIRGNYLDLSAYQGQKVNPFVRIVGKNSKAVGNVNAPDVHAP